MRIESTRDALGLFFLVAELAVTPFIVPDWSLAHLVEPPYLAALASIITSLLILGLWIAGKRGSQLERQVLALFLAGMPVIYLASLALEPQPGWLAIELVGLVLFVGLAFLGWTRSVWFLAGGIAAHGVFWDAWHHGRVEFVPSWYTLGCFIVDVGLGIYVATQVPRFRLRAISRRAAYSPQPRSTPGTPA
jgi:hypothetical protein